jgi:hypothetical protein
MNKVAHFDQRLYCFLIGWIELWNQNCEIQFPVSDWLKLFKTKILIINECEHWLIKETFHKFIDFLKFKFKRVQARIGYLSQWGNLVRNWGLVFVVLNYVYKLICNGFWDISLWPISHWILNLKSVRNLKSAIQK